MSHTDLVPKFKNRVRVSFSGRMIASQAIDAGSIPATRTLFLKQAADASSTLRGSVEEVASSFEERATTCTETVRFDSLQEQYTLRLVCFDLLTNRARKVL